MTSPHVCFVGLGNLPVLAPEYSDRPAGGEELQHTLLARALARRGWRVSMIVADYGQADEAVWDGVKTALAKEWQELKDQLRQQAQAELLPEARGLTFRIAEMLIGSLFLVDVASHPGREVEVMCLRYMAKKEFVDASSWAGLDKTLELDQAIVYGPANIKDGGVAKL